MTRWPSNGTDGEGKLRKPVVRPFNDPTAMLVPPIQRRVEEDINKVDASLNAICSKSVVRATLVLLKLPLKGLLPLRGDGGYHRGLPRFRHRGALVDRKEVDDSNQLNYWCFEGMHRSADSPAEKAVLLKKPCCSYLWHLGRSI